MRKDKRGDTPTAQDKLSPRNCPRAERSTFKRAVWRLVSSSGRLPIVKQNRYNRHGRRELQPLARQCTPLAPREDVHLAERDEYTRHLLAEVGTGSVSAVYMRLVTTVAGQLFAQ